MVEVDSSILVDESGDKVCEAKPVASLCAKWKGMGEGRRNREGAMDSTIKESSKWRAESAQ